jgi:Clathrin light chain
MSDDDFFAVPPADAPIVLEPPDTYGDYGDFSSPPPPMDGNDFASAPTNMDSMYETAAYVGDVNEAPMMNDDDPFATATGGMTDETALVSTSAGPTPMSIWNDEWQALLLVRKEEENTRRAELAEEARVALEAFQKEREVKREGTMSKNRNDEQSKLEAIEADLENDNSWQRVCKMVELQSESTDKSLDVKRMRDVLILLKNDTAKASALSV